MARTGHTLRWSGPCPLVRRHSPPALSLFRVRTEPDANAHSCGVPVTRFVLPSADGARRPGLLTRVMLLLGVSVLAGLLVAGVALPVVGGLGMAAKRGAEQFDSLPSELKAAPLPQRTRILAADGSVIAQFYYENRVSVPLTEVAPVMRQAIVAIEDAR